MPGWDTDGCFCWGSWLCGLTCRRWMRVLTGGFAGPGFGGRGLKGCFGKARCVCINPGLNIVRVGLEMQSLSIVHTYRGSLERNSLYISLTWDSSKLFIRSIHGSAAIPHELVSNILALTTNGIPGKRTISAKPPLNPPERGILTWSRTRRPFSECIRDPHATPCDFVLH